MINDKCVKQLNPFEIKAEITKLISKLQDAKDFENYEIHYRTLDQQTNKNILIKLLFKELSNINETNDDKLNELRKIIYSKISNPINENNKKIIIFSSYADTATYIYDSIQKELKDKGIYCALATGSYNKTNNDDVRTLDMNELLTYFSPKSKQLSNTKLKQNVNIDILIATDCISEGQNLQDCDYLINYDIH